MDKSKKTTNCVKCMYNEFTEKLHERNHCQCECHYPKQEAPKEKSKENPKCPFRVHPYGLKDNVPICRGLQCSHILLPGEEECPCHKQEEAKECSYKKCGKVSICPKCGKWFNWVFDTPEKGEEVKECRKPFFDIFKRQRNALIKKLEKKLDVNDIKIIESTPEKGWEELTERIVIEYANLSGRETTNRAEFRERVGKLLRQELASQREKTIGEEAENNKKWFDRGYSQFRHNLLMELREKMPKKQEKPKGKCLNAENHLFGNCFECVKIDGFNQAISEFESLLKELEK